MWILGQNAADRYLTLVAYGFVLIFLLLLLFIIVIWLRKKTLSEGPDVKSGGFLLSDLRKMKDEGKLSAEEYEKAKAAIVGAARPKASEKGGQSPKNGDVE